MPQRTAGGGKGGSERQRIAPDGAAGPARSSGTRSCNGLNDRGAHCFTYAIWTPVVESTRSAASMSDVNRSGNKGDPA